MRKGVNRRRIMERSVILNVHWFKYLLLCNKYLIERDRGLRGEH